METLETMGGERKVFQNTSKTNPLTTGKPVRLIMEHAYTKEAEARSKAEGLPLDEFPIDMLEIDLPKTNSIKEMNETRIYYDDFLMRTADSRLIYDEATGKCYALKTYAFNRLCQSEYFKSFEDGSWTISDFKVEPSKVDGVKLELDEPFSAISFDKSNPEWVKAAELLAKFDITTWSPHHKTYSSWVVCENGDRAYLVRAKDVAKLAAGLDMDRTSFLETRQPPIGENKPTAILTMNQESIYESYINEMAVFALEGMNVLAYNNPGKGFSTGTPDRENINASIDAAYQYVKEIKGVEDKDILAKGQCFGVAPTAWLGAQHPEINLMLDQGGSSFHELAMSIMENKIEDIKDKKPFFAWIGKLLLQNFIIQGLVKALFSGYTTSEDVKKNKGRKIINVNVPNIYRQGGDEMVPHYHTEKFAEAGAIEAKGSKIRVSMNPGAYHVTDWFFGEESYEAVTDFLRSIKLMRDEAKLPGD